MKNDSDWYLSLSPSPLANPYVIGRDGDRDEVVEKYRRITEIIEE